MIDDIAPVVDCPDDVSTLTCLDQIACPEDVLASVTATDNCDDNPTIELIDDTGEPQCVSGTFSRIYTFKATDVCGNSTECTVTYSGTCQEFCTLTQGGWGNAGGKYPWNNSDGKARTQTIIDALVANYSTDGFILIGDEDCESSLKIYPECVTTLLPASDSPGQLPDVDKMANDGNDCKPYNGRKDLNKDGSLRTVLAGQTVALQLNMWYSLEMFGTSLGSVSLANACFNVSGNLPGGITSVQLLLEAANEVLGGCNHGYKKGEISAINATIDAINNYYHECVQPNSCESQVLPDEGPAIVENLNEVFPDVEVQDDSSIRAYPNPAYDIIKLDFGKEHTGDAMIKVYDALGRYVREYKVDNAKGEIQLDLPRSMPDGMYYLRIWQKDQFRMIPIVVSRTDQIGW